MISAYPPQHRNYRDDPALWLPIEFDATVRGEAFVLVEYGTVGPTRIGAGTWLMPYVHVGHDAQVGERCEIASHSVVGAHCVVGDGVRLGIGTVLRPGVRVGDGARTGCGAVVVDDIPAGETWVGNPARRLVPAAEPVDERVEAGIREAWERVAELAERRRVEDRAEERADRLVGAHPCG